MTCLLFIYVYFLFSLCVISCEYIGLALVHRARCTFILVVKFAVMLVDSLLETLKRFSGYQQTSTSPFNIILSQCI